MRVDSVSCFGTSPLDADKDHDGRTNLFGSHYDTTSTIVPFVVARALRSTYRFSPKPVQAQVGVLVEAVQTVATVEHEQSLCQPVVAGNGCPLQHHLVKPVVDLEGRPGMSDR